jgi:Galactose oxidase, central domain
MTFDVASNQLLLFGGSVPGGTGALNDTWVWSGQAWSQLVVSPRPEGRVGAAIAYDAIRRDVVLFGGEDTDGTPYDDTWTWDGSSWSRKLLTVNPPARNLASIAFDDAMGKVVMFGGWNPVVGGAAKLNDTWTWDGATWTQLFPTTVPSKRGSAVMDYHAGTRNLVMFGGDIGDSTNETWTFNGTDWSLVAPGVPSPSPRDATVMVRDDVTNTLVLFGGEELITYGSVSPGNDTWTWDGKVWTQLQPSVSPPPRGVETLVASIGYDQTLGKVVLYGGTNDLHPLGDTWTWDGSTWTDETTNPACKNAT